MTEAAKQARRKYQREYYARTRERQKEYKERYWARKAKTMGAGSDEIQTGSKAEAAGEQSTKPF